MPIKTTIHILRNHISPLYLLLLLLMAIATGCKSEQFSEEKPYAVVLSKFRQAEDAENMRERLLDLGLNSYILVEQSPEGGLWFKLLAGAEERLEKMMARKIDFEDAYGFKELTIVNFHKMRPNLSPYNAKTHRSAQKPQQKPSLQSSPAAFEMAPFASDFQISRLAFYLPTAEISMNKIPLLRKDPMDLPRGISTYNLENIAENVAEIVYKDPIRHDLYTLHIIKINKSKTGGDNQAEAFSQRVINTREYEFEEMLPESISAELPLSGFLVNLMVKRDEYRRYIILTDPAENYLFFLQASNNNLKNMRSLLEATGRKNGLFNYRQLSTLFHLLPSKKTMPDELALYKYKQITAEDGYSNPRIWGQSESNYLYFNDEKGLWQAKVMLFESDSSARAIFNEWYDHKRIKKEETNVFGQRALFAYSRRRPRQGGRLTDMVNELQFCREPFIAIFSNNNRAWLTGAELTDKALQFRFDGDPDQ